MIKMDTISYEYIMFWKICISIIFDLLDLLVTWLQSVWPYSVNCIDNAENLKKILFTTKYVNIHVLQNRFRRKTSKTNLFEITKTARLILFCFIKSCVLRWLSVTLVSRELKKTFKFSLRWRNCALYVIWFFPINPQTSRSCQRIMVLVKSKPCI